jgi:thiamine-monophosphate kinase
MKKNLSPISDIGEFNLIDRLKKILPAVEDPGLLVNIGDDTAVIQVNEQEVWLITCDIQIEGRHFRLENTSFYNLGKRSMAVNLSDIAAMGGQPAFALVSLGLSPDMTVNNYDSLFEGMRDQLAEFNAHIIGGNLAKSEKNLIIDITMLGKAKPNQFVQRKGASFGDQIYVTGTLGDSGAGLALLEKFGREYPRKYEPLIQAHVSPKPRIDIGKKLAEKHLATAMIDISDGVASDLYHTCKMNKVGAVIDFEKLPFSTDIPEVVHLCKLDREDLLLHSGEDYELLFTVAPDNSPNLLKQLSRDFSIPISHIGTIFPPEDGYKIHDGRGIKRNLNPAGWDHFKKQN